MIITDWNGFERQESEFAGHRVLAVLPEKAAAGNPWIWRAEFFGAFAGADIEMLRRGWHVVYCQVSDRYGCPESIEIFKSFYDYITKEYGLSEKAAMFGFSRGGLYTVNYALKYPETLSCIYLDAPVLDIRSWPGGFYASDRYESEWEECKCCYRITEEEAASFDENPLDRLGELYDTGLPVLIVAGDSDEVVPYDENAGKLIAFYHDRGVEVEHYIKPGCGHHPHSLEDPTPIVRFLELHK